MVLSLVQLAVQDLQRRRPLRVVAPGIRNTLCSILNVDSVDSPPLSDRHLLLILRLNIPEFL